MTKAVVEGLRRTLKDIEGDGRTVLSAENANVAEDAGDAEDIEDIDDS